MNTQVEKLPLISTHPIVNYLSQGSSLFHKISDYKYYVE